MIALQTLTLVANSFVLILTLGTIQALVLRCGWRTLTGLAVLQMVITIVTHHLDRHLHTSRAYLHSTTI